MSKHWNPDGEIERCVRAQSRAARAKRAWPEGATAGLLLVAAACAGLAVVLYQIAGPRDIFAP